MKRVLGVFIAASPAVAAEDGVVYAFGPGKTP
jgi:hypothetical protein